MRAAAPAKKDQQLCARFSSIFLKLMVIVLQVLLCGYRATASLLPCQGWDIPKLFSLCPMTWEQDSAWCSPMALPTGLPPHPEPPEISSAGESWVTLTCLTISSQGPMSLLFVLLGEMYSHRIWKNSGRHWVIFHCFHSNSIIAPAAKILNLRWKCLPGISPLLSPVAEVPWAECPHPLGAAAPAQPRLPAQAAAFRCLRRTRGGCSPSGDTGLRAGEDQKSTSWPCLWTGTEAEKALWRQKLFWRRKVWF